MEKKVSYSLLSLASFNHTTDNNYNGHTHTGEKEREKDLKRHVYIVGCSMGHLSDTNAPLYKDHLSTKTTITWSLEWLL